MKFIPNKLFWRSQPRLMAGIAIGLAAGGIGSAAVLAAIPDGSGVIHGCYDKNGGLTVIDSATTSCKTTQTALNWNQTGPQGPAGPAGPQGPQGPAGSSGGVGGMVSNLVGADFTNANLVYHNFDNADMHGLIAAKAILNGSSFVNANLSGMVLSLTPLTSNASVGPSFRNANFTGANLTNTSLLAKNGWGTDTGTADFTGANLSHADFSGAYLPATVTGVNAQSAKFINAKLQLGAADGSANFQSADFTGAQIKTIGGGDFRNAIFANAQLTNISAAKLNGLNLTTAKFQTDCGLNASDLSNADLTGQSLPCSFTDVVITGTKFVQAVFSGSTFVASSTAALGAADFTNAQFIGANLSGTNLNASNFTGATWSNTTCSDGTNSDANGNTCIGHLVP